MQRFGCGCAALRTFSCFRNWSAPLFAVSVASCLLCAATAQTGPEQLLLKDYRPKSIYNLPQTRITKARYPAVDMHAHVYARNESEVDQWVRAMDEAGIAKAVVMTQATGKAFEEMVARFRKYPGRFSLWCGLDLTGYDAPGFGPGAIAELERCRRAGAEGVGELGDKGKGLFYGEPKAWGLHLDDPRLAPLLDKCGELGLPVNIHVADPKWMYEPMDAHNDGLMNAYKWRLDNQTNALGHQALIDTLERAAKKHPRTVFIACHFANCCYDLGKLGALFDRYPNLYADISARYAETATVPRFVAGFYRKYQDRLVYGTDMGRAPEMYRTTFRVLESADEHFYAWDLFSYHWPLHGLALPDAVLKKVYRDNALRLLAQPRGREKRPAAAARVRP
jgi:predicted TIM-barrel fold metal-dependent hydrolase